MTAHAGALRSLIDAGVVVVDGDDTHYANVRGSVGDRYVKTVVGDYSTEYDTPASFVHGDDNGPWRLLAVRPDVLAAAEAK